MPSIRRPSPGWRRHVLGLLAPAAYRRALVREGAARASGCNSELRIVLAAAQTSSLFVDVGANRGLHSAFADANGATVLAFEPLPSLARQLGRVLPTVDVRQIALSDRRSTRQVVVPTIAGRPMHSRASIDLRDQGDGPERTFEVRTERLDEQAAIDRPFHLKVDVEGHELAVVDGGRSKISEFCQVAIIESEERHTAGGPERTVSLFSDLGFDGWVLTGERLVEAKHYEASIHQTREQRNEIAADRRDWSVPSTYGNNFLFIRRSQSAAVLSELERTGLYVGDP